MEPLTIVLSSISITNIIVLFSLIGVFILSYTKTKAQFPLAMIVFCGFLVLHNLIGAQAYFTVGNLFSEQIFPYLLGVHGAELAGLLIFFKISYQ
jgi:hypothetical protein